MRKFKSLNQAQQFLNVHAAVYNLFNLGRHLVSPETYRFFRLRSFASWKNAAMICVSMFWKFLVWNSLFANTFVRPGSIVYQAFPDQCLLMLFLIQMFRNRLMRSQILLAI